jgi:acetyl-CoA carboxylase biotin carboxyl carrier protein
MELARVEMSRRPLTGTARRFPRWQLPSSRALRYRPAPMAKVIKAHITGTVWKIEVKVGDMVEEGTTVAILESMKMEMPVESEEEGEIVEILIIEGQPVTEGAPLMNLK